MKKPLIKRFLLPLAVTCGLLAWLFSRITPQQLAEAASQLDWPPLLLATAVMVVALYLWDAACLPTVYSVDGNSWPYARSLYLRGVSYLGGAVNYELGQAALAWGMARLQNIGVVRMLSRSVLLAYHGILVLLAAGWLGSILTDDPRMTRIRPYITAGLLIAIALAALFWSLPTSFRARFRSTDAESFLEGWSLGRSLRLLSLRAVYFGILVVYAAVALRICGLHVDHQVVLGSIPLVLLADGLPNFAGLGTRETALQLLLQPERPAVLLAMSLFWSAGLIIGRLAIALAHLWGQQLLLPAEDNPTTPPNEST